MKRFIALALWLLDLGVWWAFGRERYEIERRISSMPHRFDE